MVFNGRPGDAKAVTNNADPLCKYLRRFDFEFSQITAGKI